MYVHAREVVGYRDASKPYFQCDTDFFAFKFVNHDISFNQSSKAMFSKHPVTKCNLFFLHSKCSVISDEVNISLCMQL